MEINKIYNENCLETMAKMPDNFIDLTVTSPPYDNLREYKGYSFDFENVAKELFRITKQGGVVVWNVNDKKDKGTKTLTSFKQALFFKEIGFFVHDIMIWEKCTFSSPISNMYHNVFEYMFILTKGKPKTFNPIKDRLNKQLGRKKHGTVRQIDGSLKPISSIGKQIGKYGQRFNVWNINTEVSNTKRCHPAQFPEKLAEDHIRSWTKSGDVVLDPFMGSGTTGVVCKKLERDFIGIELVQEYYNLAKERIKNTPNSLFI